MNNKGILDMISGKTFLIDKVSEVEALQSELIIFAAVIALLFLAIAAMIVNTIKNQGGANPREQLSRRIWFVGLGLLVPLSIWIFNTLLVQNIFIKATASLVSTFSGISLTAILVSVGLYFGIGLGTSYFLSKGKWATITHNRTIS